MGDQVNKELVAEFWESYLRSLAVDAQDLPHEYQAWSFGYKSQTADTLGKLVLSGIKTATASLAWAYEREDEPYPVVGGYSVILDGEGRPLCIIQTTEVSVVPFNQVGEDHAYQEGEGDRSLGFWREVHWRFFADECESLGLAPDEEMPVVCEKFELVFQ